MCRANAACRGAKPFFFRRNISLVTISSTPLHISSLNWCPAATSCTSCSRSTEGFLVTSGSMYGVSWLRRHLPLVHYCYVCAPCVYFDLFTTAVNIRNCFLLLFFKKILLLQFIIFLYCLQ